MRGTGRVPKLTPHQRAAGMVEQRQGGPWGISPGSCKPNGCRVRPSRLCRVGLRYCDPSRGLWKTQATRVVPQRFFAFVSHFKRGKGFFCPPIPRALRLPCVRGAVAVRRLRGCRPIGGSSIPPTRRCGLCIPRLAPERRGKSRSRRRTSSPHQTRLRWASAGAPV